MYKLACAPPGSGDETLHVSYALADTRTCKGGPTGVARATRGGPVGVTNCLMGPEEAQNG